MHAVWDYMLEWGYLQCRAWIMRSSAEVKNSMSQYLDWVMDWNTRCPQCTTTSVIRATFAYYQPSVKHVYFLLTIYYSKQAHLLGDIEWEVDYSIHGIGPVTSDSDWLYSTRNMDGVCTVLHHSVPYSPMQHVARGGWQHRLADYTVLEIWMLGAPCVQFCIIVYHIPCSTRWMAA